MRNRRLEHVLCYLIIMVVAMVMAIVPMLLKQ